MGLLLLGAAAAEAQTPRILVSNVGQAADDVASTSGNDHAQLFHTGDHSNGYTLTSVIVVSEDAQGDAFDVDICTADGTSDDFPTTTCTALTAPASFTAGNLEFTHAGLALSAGTNYVVVVKPRAGANVAIDSTTSGGEDSTGIDAMWSIKGYFYWHNGTTWANQSGLNEVLQITVNGYEVVTPAVSSVEITDDPNFPTYGYAIDDVIPTTVTFSAAVDITGTPQLELDFDGTAKAAACATGTNTTTMVCSYTVLVGDSAPNGIAIAANTLTGGTITATGSTTITADLAHAAVAIDAGQKVDGILPTLVTTGSDAPTTSTDGTQVILTFSETIGSLDLTKINISAGNIPQATTGATRTGTKVEIDLTTALTTTSTTLTVELAEHAVVDGAFNGILAVAATAVINAVVSATTPTVTGVALTSDPGPDNTYGIGDAVEATVTFSEAVDITGTPQLELDFAGTAKAAACATGTNTTTMACEYEVVAGDVAAGGVAIGTNTLTGGTIYATGSTTNSADLDHVAVGIDAGQKVDGIRPTLVTTGSEAPTTSTDGTQVILTFSENVPGVNRFNITIGIGGGNVAQTSAARTAGTTVELDLSTVIDATVMVTVALGGSAVFDRVGNGNLAVAATAVINAITANASPTFSAATATRSVPENTAANTNIGTALPAATDTDNDPLTYTLEGADATSFGFDAATRQLSTKSGVTYDRETQLSYSVTLKADDGNGGTDTIAVTITLTNVIEPPGRPAAPSVSSVAGSTTSLSVNWSAPSNTGPAIDTYDLRYREGTSGAWTNGPQNVSGTSATIGSLTEGTSYQVQVLATNAEGDSPWSLPGSGQTGALGAPDVPHSLDATPGNRQVMLSWVQPSGGAEVTDYEYEQDGSGTWISTGSTATDYTVRNLTNGQPYTFRVRAANSAGPSAASTASASVIPATVPGAPTNIGVTGGDQEVELNWTAPASNGGESITGYEYEQSGSGTWISTGGTATGYTVFNLTNGQPYRFRVRAVNSVGEGAASAASANVTPATEPDAPTGLSATVSDQQVVLIWTAPTNDGGATLLRYEYELDFSGTWTSTGGTTTSTTVRNLTNGQSYNFRVRAANRVGSGLASGSRSAAPTATLAAPNTPFGLNATPGNQQVRLDWVQPSGGAALTHYEYELDGSDTWTSTGSAATSTTVMGLTNGQSYTFRVRALNSAGASGASGSRSATPTTTAPDALQSLSFTPGNGQVTLRWRAPTNDGGAMITYYEYDQDFSGIWISTGSTATSHTVTGLNNGRTYTFRVRAVNAQGAGAEVTLQATPSPSTSGGGGGTEAVRPPSPPRDLTAMAGDQAVQLSWRRPAEDGGARIVRYEYRQQEGDGPFGAWQIIGADPPPTDHTVTGLMNGVSYTFQVRAVNSREASPPSESASATPEPELAPFEVAIVGVPEVAVAGASYELTAQSDAEEALVYAWRVAYGEGGSVEPTDTQTVVWTAPSGVTVAWIRVDVTREEDGATAGQSAYVRVDVPAPPTTLALSHDAAPAEGAGTVTVTATLDNPAPSTGTTVTLTAGGTARLDTDYTLSSTTITLAAGETAGTVTITVIDDAEDDDGETIVLHAASTSPALTAEPLTLTIEDNDVTPVPALPLLGQLLLALGLTGAGARLLSRRPRVPPAA